jgi:putative phosphoribosyl transferase
MAFKNRSEAGLILARKLRGSQNWEDGIVLGLPRGGVPVAFEVARVLNLPLDIFTVRKLGVPGYEELAMGAVASDGTVVINEAVVREFGISQETLDAVAQREQLEIERREGLYREGRSPLAIDGRSAILVDDGLATGASMLAAVRALRPRARQVIVAVPVAAKRTCLELSREVDGIVCVITPRSFMAVGMFYGNFEPTTDEEVRSLLAKAHSDQTTQAA